MSDPGQGEAGCADGIDWAGVWRCRYERHASQPGFSDSVAVWSRHEEAARYERAGRDHYEDRVLETIGGLALGPGSRVLDIGAGPGTLAIPLAERGARITAVEPATGMADLLEQKADERGITTIRVVRARWEDVDPSRDLDGLYDCVIASLSLSMPLIREALVKMVAVCSGTVNLYWFADPPLWERISAEIWPVLHGTMYTPGPKADCLLMVLGQMGIVPDVHVMPLDKTYRFSDAQAAMDHFRARLGITTPGQGECARQYFFRYAGSPSDGIVIRGRSRYARIWWRNTPDLV